MTYVITNLKNSRPTGWHVSVSRLHMMAQQLNSGFITHNGFSLALRNIAESVTLSEKLLFNTKSTICPSEEH